MPCDTQRLPQQSLQERITEVKSAIAALDALIKKRRVKVKVGPQGAVTFVGWEDRDRGRVTDACAYRRLMATGSILAKAEIARAEMIAGRSVDKLVVGQGVHSHDGGATWASKG